MKTKPFLLATAGSTVDGRVIDANMLTEMAAGYDPKTYGARLNIEHIRGISGQSPFRAYGDVLELSVADVDVNIHGKTEKRKGLYGVFDITDEAKELNGQSQKVYPSIEIEQNFAGSGKAYLMGVALTDSPASVATERLQFNRARPGSLNLKADDAAQAFALEFADASVTDDKGADSFLGKLGELFDGFSAKFAPANTEPNTPTTPKEGEPAAFNVADLRPLFDGIGESFSQVVRQLKQDAADRADQAELRFKALEAKFETTPANNYAPRPLGAGGNGNQYKADY